MPSMTTSDGVRLDYLQSGDAAGRPVVLIAGFKAAATTWLYQTAALESAGYRVIALDTRGHGTSETPASGFSMERRGLDLGDFLDALDLHDVVIVGQSMGANTIWAHLAGGDSTRIAGVVSIDQTPKMLNTADWRFGFYGYDESTRDTLFASGVPDTGHGTPMLLRGMRLVRLLSMIRRTKTPLKNELTPGELELLGDHARKDWRETIAASAVPVLFIAGRASEFWPCEHAAASAALAPHGSSVIIEKAGHPTNIEQPTPVNRVLLEFLSGL